MLKVFATQVIISRGYEDKPAVNITRTNDASVVRFRIGKKVYDPKAEDNTRWLNYSVKGFGAIADRVEKMQLKEGSVINLMGRLDEDVWEDENHVKKSATVIVLEDIEYASSGQKKENGNQASGQQNNGAGNGNTSNQASAPAPANTGNSEGGFTGYEAFSGNPFF